MSEPEDFPITIEVRALPEVQAPDDFLSGRPKRVERGATVSLTVPASELKSALSGDSVEVVEFIRQAVDRVYRSCCQESL